VNSDLQEDANGGLLDDDRQFSEESFDGKKSLHHYAVPALSLLAELLAPVLDIIFQSDEKEKVTPSMFDTSQMFKNCPVDEFSSFLTASEYGCLCE
jgi:hypothetical protein